MRTEARRPKRDELPIVSVQRPRCPYCGSVKVRPVRSTTDSDGVVTRDTHCQEQSCRQRFFVIVE